MTKHNKKRNVGIIYELLLRHMSNALIENNKKNLHYATKLIEKRFNKKSEIYKEFRLFNAIAKSNVSATSSAASILLEAKNVCRNIDNKKLDIEKSKLIKDINYNIVKNDNLFYHRNIPNYKDLANIQSGINEWKKGEYSNLRKSIQIEEKIINFLMTEKKETSHEEEYKLVNESKSNELVYNIMVKKINNKYKDMTPDQKNILRAYAFKDDKINLTETLLINKKICIDKISTFQKNNNNSYLEKQINEVKNKINSLDPENINDKSIIQFLTVAKLIKELE